MVFKATSTESIAKRRGAGFVITDLLVGTALTAIVMLGVTTLSTFSLRSFGAMANYVNLDQCSRNALDKMSKEIRQCDSLLASDYNYLWFQNPDGSNLLYYYVPSSQILYRLSTSGTGFWVMDSRPLLTGCTYLNFGIFQRNPILGTYDQYPAATPSTCKLVQLTWVCNRSLVNTWNTESVQSAKVVIRKE
jgi:hypothetical protein